MTDENDVNQVLSAVIHQAINSQKDACNAILPLLDSHFNGKTASVVDAFQLLESSRVIFYGIYAKEVNPSGTVV